MAIVKKPIILDETAQSINATLRQIKNAIVDSGGGGDISSKADKVEDAPEGNIAILVNGGNLGDGKHKLTDYVLKEGTKVLSDNNYSDSDKEKVKNAITEHQDISGKADKVPNATSGHLAALDLEGNIIDSGSKPSDFASAAEQTELKENLTQLDSDVVSLSDEVGINLWNEKWKNGYYADGNFIVNNNYICSADLCEIKSNINVYVYTASSVGRVVLSFYDVNKSFISILPARNEIVTTPNNACYFTIYHEAEQTTYNHDICINVSNPSINGTYYPFRGLRKDIKQISNETLDIKMLGWSVPQQLGVSNYMDTDRKFHQRVGRVDLGSLDWQVLKGLKTFFVSSDINGRKYLGALNTENIYTVRYNTQFNTQAEGQLIDKSISGTGSGTGVVIYDTSYTDLAPFKASLQGVYLYYELAEEIVMDVDGNEIDVTSFKHEIFSQKDINNYVEDNYFGIGSDIINVPVPYWSTIFVIKGTRGSVDTMQICISPGAHHIYTRGRVNGVWDNWDAL